MAGKEGNIDVPNWPAKDVLDHSRPLPATSDGKIPPHTAIKPFAGLPASTMPKPMKMEGQ